MYPLFGGSTLYKSFSSSLPSAYTPCKRDNGKCSDICVTKARISGGVKAGCLCEVGYPLLDDGKTCASGIASVAQLVESSLEHRVLCLALYE